MTLRTGRTNNHVHHYNPGDRTTSFDHMHNHMIIVGTPMTSINQGHKHSLINTNDGIVSF